MIFNGFFLPQGLLFGEVGGKGVTKVHSRPTLVHVLSRPSPGQATLATIRSFYGVPVGGDSPQGLQLWLELKKIGDLPPPYPPIAPPFPFLPLSTAAAGPAAHS
jgi:hypothetical protein